MADPIPSGLQPVVERRRRGRPPVAEPRASISTWMPASTHDKLIALAKRDEVSISALVRSLLILQINRTPGA